MLNIFASILALVAFVLKYSYKDFSWGGGIFNLAGR